MPNPDRCPFTDLANLHGPTGPARARMIAIAFASTDARESDESYHQAARILIALFKAGCCPPNLAGHLQGCLFADDRGEPLWAPDEIRDLAHAYLATLPESPAL